MPLAEGICIRPSDGGTLTIITNKCSIVRNAPSRMNMHPPRQRWYTNHRRQQMLPCQKCTLPNEYASAPAPRPLPLLLPRSELHRRRPPVLPYSCAHVTLSDSSGGACARSRVQGCRSSRNHSIVLDPSGELSGFSLVPCSDCGMARVVEGWTQKEGENHGRIYFKCARNLVSSLLFLPNLS
jgi:hypothetical protein